MSGWVGSAGVQSWSLSRCLGVISPPGTSLLPTPAHTRPQRPVWRQNRRICTRQSRRWRDPCEELLVCSFISAPPPQPPHPPATTGEAADGRAGPSVGKPVQGKQELCFTREGGVPACPQCLLRPVVRARRGVHPAGPPAQTRLLIVAGARPSRSEQDPRQHRVLPRLAPTGI